MKKEKASYDIRGDRNHSWEKREIAGRTASFGSPTEKRGQNGSCWIPSKSHAKGGRRYIVTAWEIENAAEKLARSKKTRLELLQEVKEKECTEGCGELWKFVPKKS